MAGKIEPLSALHEAPTRRKVKEAKKENLKKARSLKTMVKMAIKENPDRKGTSLQALYNYIEANYAVKDNYRRYLKQSLARQVDAGVLIKRSPIRYSLSAKAKKTSKNSKSPKKSTEKKVKVSPKKTAATKQGTEKKAKTPAKKTKMSVEKAPKAGARTTRAAAAKTIRAAPTPKAKTTRGSTPAKAKTTRSTKEKTTELSDKTESEGSGKLVWAWQYFNNGFYNYDSDASDVVESVYQEYLSSPYTCDVRAVKSGDWEYEIDFRIMTQRNLRHEAHTSRKIRRIQILESEKFDKKKRYEGTPDEPKSSSSSN
jgi:hypothetical protein